jgi:hypothetical protein
MNFLHDLLNLTVTLAYLCSPFKIPLKKSHVEFCVPVYENALLLTDPIFKTKKIFGPLVYLSSALHNQFKAVSKT